MDNKLILVIDDEVDIREIAQISLEMSKGWKVLTASSGKAGLELATQEKPDAILLDVAMPNGMSGLETLQNLKKNLSTQKIPVILLTATARTTTAPEFTQFGARAVLLKPFDPVLLAHQVEEILNWQK